MKRIICGGIMLCVAAVAMVGTAPQSAERETSLLAQAESSPEKADRTTSATAAPARKLSGRLPSGYGKLGVSDDQRQAIYAIQHKYEAQIADLEKQIEALEARIEEESEALLTTAQKARLKEVREASQKKRAGSRSRRTSASAE